MTSENAAVPLCGITTPHNHSSFDDPLACAWRDQVTVLTGDQVERTLAEKRAVEPSCRHLKLVAVQALQSWLGESAWCDICRDYRDVVIER